MVVSAGFLLWNVAAKVFISEFTDIILILGFSLIGLVPGFILYFTARSIRKHGPSYEAGAIATLFSLPLLLLSIVLFSLPAFSASGAGVVGFGALLILFWGVVTLRRARMRKS